MGTIIAPESPLAKQLQGEPLVHDTDSIKDGRLVTFQNRRIQPPSTLYIGLDDLLVVQVNNSDASQSLGINARLLLPSGDIVPQHWDFTPTSDKTSNFLRLNLAECFILSVTVWGKDNAAQPGQTYVQVWLARNAGGGNFPYALVCAGYVYGAHIIGSPGQPPQGPLDGPGYVNQFYTATPPVGTNATTTCPSYTVWRPLTVLWQFSTSANPTARNGGTDWFAYSTANLFWKFVFGSSQPASQIYFWVLGRISGDMQSVFTFGHMTVSIPDIKLLPTWGWKTEFNPLAAGDQVSYVLSVMEEWILPQDVQP